MDVFARIDQARRECNVLEHPFYQRWSAGTLTERELDVYAKQYRHAVVALARASSMVAQQAAAHETTAEHASPLERHAAEESAHVALWDEFSRASSAAVRHVSAPEAPADEPAFSETAFPETQQCARSWTAGEGVLERLAVLYAIESAQPETSRTKLDGLVGRYGYSEEGPATEYFRLHATLDVEHARQARELIERLMGAGRRGGAETEPMAAGADGMAAGADGTAARTERMVARARAALRGNWALLDGVEGRCGGVA
jgi:pyrroloquinoline-quinone synthase